MKRALLVLALSSSLVASAMPTAVERGVVVQGGLHFQKTIVLDQNLRTEGGGTLLKGSYEVHFDSLAGNKVRASFFQGGARKGEANGIIIVNSVPAADKAHRGAAVSFEDLGLRPTSAHAFRMQGQRLDLVVGQQGTNQILIGLLLPAVQKGGIIAPTDLRGQKVQPGK
jgi:hypothetical protein